MASFQSIHPKGDDMLFLFRYFVFQLSDSLTASGKNYAEGMISKSQ